MSRKRMPTPHIKVSIDFGGSSTKAIVEGDERQVVAFVMSPSITEIPGKPRFIPEIMGAPEDNAAIKIENSWYAIGRLADVEGAMSNLHLQKADIAIYKALAAIWAAVRKLGLNSCKIKVSLTCLLPSGEMGRSSQLESEIKRLSPQIESVDGNLEVAVVKFNCYPEGVGISREFGIKAEREIRDLSYLVVMMGHRNISVFTAMNTTFSGFASCNLGFSSMVDKVVEQVALGYSPEKLSPVITDYLIGGDEEQLGANLRAIGGRVSDATLIKNSTDTMKRIYWGKVSDWINRKCAKYLPISLVVLGGGTSEIFKDEIIHFFSDKLPPILKGKPGIFFHAGQDDIKMDIPKGYEKRFQDIYFVWKNLC